MKSFHEPAWLRRALSPVAQLLPGELGTALLLTLNVFLLLTTYYVIKPVREALILALASGAEYKSYMSGAIAILLLFAVPAYARFVDKLPRVRLVVSVTLFFAANLLLFWLLIQMPALRSRLGLVFYAWVGVFNMMVVAQFWSFASDVYDEKQGARLFPLLALGGSLGAAVGSKVSALLIPLLGVEPMLLVASVTLASCALLFWLVERRQATAPVSEVRVAPVAQKTPQKTAPSGAFKLVLSQRYLRLVALFSLVFSWVNSNGEYMLGRLIRGAALEAVHAGRAADVGAQIGAEYARFFFNVNVIGLLLQTFVVARLVRWFGFRFCFLLFPLIALGDASVAALAPTLALVLLGKTAENAADYSLNNTLRQMLWLVTSRDVKYKAKQAVDTFFVRMGDVSSAVFVWLGAGALAFEVRDFALCNLALIGFWLALAVAIGKEHAALTGAEKPTLARPRRRLGLLGLGVLCAALLGAPSALAAETQRRALPDYDGRGGSGQPTSSASPLLWAPRIVLFPAYVVSEYALRRPLGYAITQGERAKIPQLLFDFFTFGPDHKAGIVPTAFIDFGFEPSVGLYAFGDDVGFRGHQLRLRASTWGADWLSGSFVERIHFSENASFTFATSLVRRPDFAFYGVGRDTREENLSRYSADGADVRAVFRNRLFRSSSFEASVGYRGMSFSPGDYRGQATIEERAQQGAFSLPAGYATGYRAPFWKAALTLDTRAPRSTSESGGRLELSGEQGADFANRPASGWLRYGATLGGFWDVGDRGRVLSLSVTSELSDPLGSREVPFTELVTLGGPGVMPGFRPGRLVGRSAAVATLRYSWPIWVWLDGSLQAAVGNVFGERFEGASISASRFSGALGIESRGSRDSIFQALVGFGTETFESGAQVNSIRLTLGARSGF